MEAEFELGKGIAKNVKTKQFLIDGKIGENEIAALQECGQIIKSGGLVAFPTETVYGLGGDALNPASSQKIYAAKGRPSDNPLIIHIADIESLEKIVSEVPETAIKLAEAFWPGPLTMILNKSELVPLETTGGLKTVAVRLPKDETARKLIEYAGGFIAAPSANLSGKPSPTKAKYVKEDMDGRIDAIIDGGENEIGLESTIVDLTVSPPCVLRPGYITREQLSSVLEEEVAASKNANASNDKGPKAPGMKYRHYAPKGDLTVISGNGKEAFEYIKSQIAQQFSNKSDARVGIVASSELANALSKACEAEAGIISIKDMGAYGDAITAAHRLYTYLREFDDENIEIIYAQGFGSEGIYAAFMNRLLKAAGGKEITINE